MIKKLTPAQQLWVDALRSGEYKQDSFNLHSKLGFCCLGVACDVARNNGITVKLTPKGNFIPEQVFISGGHMSDQPDVKKWLGLKDDLGAINTHNSYTTLTSLNDLYDCTFSEIADVIEWNADRLFVG